MEKDKIQSGEYAAVISRFVDKLIKNEVPTIFGDGNQKRDFTYIDNVVQANLLACKADSKLAGEVFNVACGETNSILEVYKKINLLLHKNIQPQFIEKRKGDLIYTKANIEKIQQELGYKPEYKFEEGLKSYLDWYQNNVE